MEQKETLSEEVREFNPDAFAGLDKLVDSVGQSEEASPLVENEEPEVLTNETEEEDNSDFDWGADDTQDEEEEPASEEPEDTDDWDAKETVTEDEGEEPKPEGVDWDSVASELGLEGSLRMI